MITARKTTKWVLALGLLLALCVLAIGKPSGATEVTPESVPGNPTCADRGYANELKIEGVDLDNKEYTDGTLTVTISNLVYNSEGEAVQFDWVSNIGVDEVLVKASNAANAYIYNPPAESKGDVGLIAPENKGISHINFCYDGDTVVPQPLTATKTANGSYDRTITWDLTKTVDDNYHSGLAGDSFNSIWKVTATKNDEALSNFEVKGDITIENPNGFLVDFSVTDELGDGTAAVVDCDPMEGNQDSGKVAANGSATCSYTAKPPNENVMLNKAVVTSETDRVEGTTAEKAITWQENVIGDDEVTLTDDRFPSYSQKFSDTTDPPVDFPETFKCPDDRASYDANRLYTKTFKNTATLTGVNGTNKTASAEVTLKCKYPWVDETATGAGDRYTGTSNWFMYTAFDAPPPVNLMAGQQYDAGDITFTRGGNPSTTTITITLHEGFRFANVANNLKIKDITTTPVPYVAPGKFPYKFNCSQALNTCTATGLKDAPYYGIHVDVERFVN